MTGPAPVPATIHPFRARLPEPHLTFYVGGG